MAMPEIKILETGLETINGQADKRTHGHSDMPCAEE